MWGKDSGGLYTLPSPPAGQKDKDTDTCICRCYRLAGKQHGVAAAVRAAVFTGSACAVTGAQEAGHSRSRESDPGMKGRG